MSVADELEKLVRLCEAGELSPAEFARQRLNLLGASAPAQPAPTPNPNAVLGWGQPVATPPSVSVPAGSEAKGQRSGAETLVIGLILIAIVGGAIVFLNGGRLPSIGAASANVPPVGSIWFGDSFDSNSFEIRGRKSSVGSSSSFSFVAHLTRSVDASELSIRIYWNGQLTANQAVNATGSGEIFGFSPGPLSELGEWKHELAGVGGNVLASGTITAT